MSSRLILIGVTLALAGCGASQRSAFGYQFADNEQADLAAVLAELPAAAPDDRPANPTGQAIAVASTHAENEGDRQLVALRIESGEQLWAAPFAAQTRPEILGDVVLSTTRDELVAFDLASGRVLWRRDLPDLAYVGATRGGATIYWAATVGALGGARRVGHVVAVDARSGDEHWRHEIQGVFGQPATAGGFVFVPWERQNVAILDGETGIEQARLRSTDDVIAWAFDHPSGIYYGGRGIYRLTERSTSGTRAGSTHVRPPLGELPRQPESIWPDGFLPQPGTRSARGRIRVYFDPAPAADAQSIPIEGDTYYFAYYRYVFAFDVEGNLRWTRILEQDVINAEVTANGLLAIGEQGSMRLLDRETGNDRWSHDAALPLAAVDLDASGFDPAGEGAEARTLRQSLNEMVLDPDNRLVAARGYAIAQLARIEDAEVTRDLLDLYQQRSMPGALKEAISEALRTRTSGQEFLMEALARRYDYLEDTQAPPLEAIVPALLQMQHREAVPALINHMMDHETPSTVLPQVVDAVVQLGGAEAVPALRTFLVLYQADSMFVGPVADAPAEEGGQPTRANPEARALAIAAAGIFAHGGPEGRELLASLSADGARTHAPVSEHIHGLYEAEQRAEAQRVEREAADAQAALAEQQRQEAAALPARLSQEQINQTFAENADPMRECIAGEMERNPRLNQVRLVFILANDGQASNLTVSPNTPELVQCMQERVAQIAFPRFRQRRMRGAFTVSIRGGAAEPVEGSEPAVAPIADDAPWWAWSQRRAELRGGSSVPAVAAWWTERAAPVRAEPTHVTPAVEERELPPGMVVQQQQQQQQGRQGSQQQQQQQQQGTQQQQQQGSGTPWWAAAQSDEAEAQEEQEETEEEEEAPPPRRRPRRPQR